MRIPKVSPKLGIYQKHEITHVGNSTTYSITGKIKDNTFTVYTQYENGKKIGKLYYLADKTLSCIKSKLQEFKNGKLVKQIK